MLTGLGIAAWLVGGCLFGWAVCEVIDPGCTKRWWKGGK